MKKTQFPNTGIRRTIVVYLSIILILFSCKKEKDDNDLDNNGYKIPIQDENFEKALIGLGLDDKLDGHIYSNKVENVTELDVSDKEISSLTGIEHFKSLKILKCSNNTIGDLVLYGLEKLEYLDCSHNWINRITNLHAGGRPPTELLNLKYIDYSYNLSSAAGGPYYGVNPVGVLNIAPNLEHLECIKSYQPPKLGNQSRPPLDLTKHKNLRYIDITGCYFGRIEIANHPNIEVFKFSESHTTGSLLESEKLNFSNCPKLEYVDIHYNHTVREINLFNNPSLKHLDADAEGGAWGTVEINLTHTPSIELLKIAIVNSIDLSKNVNLKHLKLRMFHNSNHDHEDIRVNLKNGNNKEITTLEIISGENNGQISNGFCIAVDDVAWSYINWTNYVPDFAEFNTDCN